MKRAIVVALLVAGVPFIRASVEKLGFRSPTKEGDDA